MKKLSVFVFLMALGAGSPRSFAQRSPQTPVPWDLNDVSILIPLPKPGEEALLWGTQTRGGQGVLLPVQVFQSLQTITTEIDAKTLYLQALRVISIRVDPCFREGPAPQPCQRQIRLVWQPVVLEKGRWIGFDATIHTFYILNDSEWRQLAENLRPTVATSTAGLPLQVHPVLRREGLNGPHWKKLNAVLLPFLGEARLIRATSMSVNPLGVLWFFSGVAVNGNKTIPLQIPRTPEPSQAFAISTQSINSLEFRSAVAPPPADDAAMLQILRDSKKAPTQMTEQQLQEGVRQALRLQNPGLHDTGTSDCVSCHISQTVSFWALRRFPQWNWNVLFKDEIFRGGGNLGNTTTRPGRANLVRAFGYFDEDPAISPRTVNETSEVVRMMRQAPPGFERRMPIRSQRRF